MKHIFIIGSLFLLFLYFQGGCASTGAAEKRLIEAEAAIKAAKSMEAQSIASTEINKAELHYELAKLSLQEEPRATGMIAFFRESDALKMRSIENALLAKKAAENAIKKVQNQRDQSTKENILLSRNTSDLKSTQEALQKEREQSKQKLVIEKSKAHKPKIPELKTIEPKTPEPKTPEPKTTEPKTTELKTIEPKTLYKEAFYLYKQQDYETSLKTFQRFFEMFPKHSLSENVQYWIGECLYSQRKYKEAIKAFQAVLINFKKGNKPADALLKVGLSYFNLHNHQKSKQSLQSVIKRYPKTHAAILARKFLNKHKNRP